MSEENIAQARPDRVTPGPVAVWQHVCEGDRSYHPMLACEVSGKGFTLRPPPPLGRSVSRDSFFSSRAGWTVLLFTADELFRDRML